MLKKSSYCIFLCSRIVFLFYYLCRKKIVCSLVSLQFTYNYRSKKTDQHTLLYYVICIIELGNRDNCRDSLAMVKGQKVFILALSKLAILHFDTEGLLFSFFPCHISANTLSHCSCRESTNCRLPSCSLKQLIFDEKMICEI